MSDVRVGAAVGAGFDLIRRKPLCVLAWGAAPVALQAMAFLLAAPLYGQFLGQIGRMAEPAAAAAAVAPWRVMQAEGLIQLINLAQLLVGSVVYCAVFRAVLQPQRSSFAYMRVGPAELFLALLIFAAILAVVVGAFVLAIPMMIVGLVVAFAAQGTGGAAALAVAPMVLFAAILLAVPAIGVRFAFAGPMMVDDDKFHLFESWTLTRGRWGSLALVALALIGISLLVLLLVGAVLVAVGAAAVQASGGLGHATAFFSLPAPVMLSRAWPYLGLYALVQVPLAGCGAAIFGAPWARAYRDAAPKLAEVFV